MKRTIKFMAMSLLLTGVLVGCDKKTEEVKVEDPKVEEPKVEAPKVEAPKVEEPKVEEAPKVDEAMYLKAAFEATCVKVHVNDAEKQKETLDAIYARYGFDGEKFAAAQKLMVTNTITTAAITEKMKLCNKELAVQLKEKESEVLLAALLKDPKVKDPKVKDSENHPVKPKPKPSVSYEGLYRGTISAVGFTKAKVRITVKRGNKVIASMKGYREGKKFTIPMSGKVSKGGKFSLSGKNGTATAKLSGSLKKTSAAGTVSGSIFKKAYSASFNAKK